MHDVLYAHRGTAKSISRSSSVRARLKGVSTLKPCSSKQPVLELLSSPVFAWPPVRFAALGVAEAEDVGTGGRLGAARCLTCWRDALYSSAAVCRGSCSSWVVCDHRLPVPDWVDSSEHLQQAAGFGHPPGSGSGTLQSG